MKVMKVFNYLWVFWCILYAAVPCDFVIGFL